MAVSKRLRFEILRRDNHTCRYCGRTPPEVEVTVDHVLPTALGGTDDANNLVTACKDCNSGKTSIAPGSALVADVDNDAIRWAAATKAASDKASADYATVRTYREAFDNAWHSYNRPALMDENWRSSIENFRIRGLPIEILTDAAHKAMSTEYIKPADKFKYVCGIAWKRIREIEKDARANFATPAGTPVDTASATVTASSDSDEWEDPTTRPVIEAAVAVWLSMWRMTNGEDPPAGLEDEVRENAGAMYPEELAPSVVIAAAEIAGQRKSADLFEHCNDGTLAALLREGARWLFYGWALEAEKQGIASRPTPAAWSAVDVLARQARAVGYSNESICEAIYRAAHDHSTAVNRYLLTITDAAAIEDPEDPEPWSPMPLRSLEEIEPLARAAEIEAAKQARRHAARRAAGPNPWGAPGETGQA